MTCVSSSCSLEIVSCGAVNVLLNLVTQMNRSFAALSLVKTIIQILLNISKVGFAVHFQYTQTCASLHTTMYHI